ncbi:malonate decarboxylase acyl carrier protein [Polynucleobacter sp. 71A-WALBACH]|uniref:malonate decarboxylase acyl carrier protein n=1 Tax=Polynucleobacter sp. 71A-WALBACH TaxID=2689097 RepID=UPI001C0BFB4C|nr:malonate decarboxylase acyl carrier protein [Polynucleobacter sp. 71A-WALBACH]MBU3593401.1 malonate decarboxylase acyl carrier protein [Polynucleobacter sp. 71A-WALBACH]
MELLNYEFGPWDVVAARKNTSAIIVGVVGSGNLEILLESAELGGRTKVCIETSVKGFSNTWEAVLRDFSDQQKFANTVITINDGGATPAVVQLRLMQAAQQWKERHEN